MVCDSRWLAHLTCVLERSHIQQLATWFGSGYSGCHKGLGHRLSLLESPGHRSLSVFVCVLPPSNRGPDPKLNVTNTYPHVALHGLNFANFWLICDFVGWSTHPVLVGARCQGRLLVLPCDATRDNFDTGTRWLSLGDRVVILAPVVVLGYSTVQGARCTETAQASPGIKCC